MEFGIFDLLDHNDLPLADYYEQLLQMGIARFVVVAETDDEVHAIDNRAYPVCCQSFNHLYGRHNTSPMPGKPPPNFDGTIALGTSIFGAPRRVADVLADQIVRSGANYPVGQVAVSDLSLPEMLPSVELFARQVMPACCAVSVEL
jgi:alkanesulfonate monooxygenase SsuD/methylene tetrahydromethanopterin reductase-like flavin-dependent oxidoreductase (luciferase family)